MKLLEQKTKEHLHREEATQRLREIADELSRQNELRFVRDGLQYTLNVIRDVERVLQPITDEPDDVEFVLEIEVGDSKSEIEMKVKWGVGSSSASKSD